MTRQYRPAPPPMETNERLVTALVTAGWAIALITLLLLRDQLPAGERWWIWTCATGFAMGLFGLWYVPRLKRLRARTARRQAAALSKPPAQPEPASPPDAAPRNVAAAPGASASPEHAAPEPQAPPLSEDRTREQVQPQAADGADMDGQAPAHPLFRPQSQVPGGPGAESAHDA